MGAEITKHYTIEELERMATAIAKSGLFGAKTPEQALALMLIAQAEGLHPAWAVRTYHIVDGRPVMRSDAMLARFLQAGGKVEWLERTDERVAARFTHPLGGSVVVEWDLARAERAGLTGKTNWQRYPRQMLTARVISEGVRTVYPAIVVGIYTPEEIQDLEPEGETVETEAPESTSAPALEGATEASTQSNGQDEVRALIQAFYANGLGQEDGKLMAKICSRVVGREIRTSKDLTREEARQVREFVEELGAEARKRGLEKDLPAIWEAIGEGLVNWGPIPRMLLEFRDLMGR